MTPDSATCRIKTNFRERSGFLPQRYAEKEKKPDRELKILSRITNKTLNLPKTDFPMRGNLPKRIAISNNSTDE